MITNKPCLGILSSAMLCLLITALFSRSAYMHGLILWGGLAINCGYVVYDTQLIAEKRRRGDTDVSTKLAFCALHPVRF